MPGENVPDWSTTAASNATADSLINWAEGQARASVNDSARSMMAAHAKKRNLENGSITTTGIANALAFTSGVSYTSGTLPTGLRVLLKISVGNTGPCTLNIDGLGQVQIVDNRTASFLLGGELVANRYAEFRYDGTNWILLNTGLAAPRKQTVATLSGAYSVLSSDDSKIFSCSGSFTLGHTVTAAQGGAGFTYWVKNTGTGTVTIDPAGSETIDGAATLACLPAQEFQVICDGTNWITLERGGAIVTVQTFTASGTYTPGAMSYCVIECIGGGGAGGGVVGNTSYVLGGGGGGAGGYSRKLATATDIGASKTVTIGAGGTAGVGNGNPGGQTSLGSLCIANGGSGGTGATTAAAGVGGAGATAGTGNVAATGASGGTGQYWALAPDGFGPPAGPGGNSYYGGGGVGGLGSSTGSAQNGGAAAGYGAGGGGASANKAANNATGGAGSSGLVIVTEFL